MKNNKGITLIALVITIIVMLILVTVTIQVATNGNLFTHAGNAVKGTKSAIEEENAILEADNIEKIVAEQTGSGSEAPTLSRVFNFTIGDTTYSANSKMTWSDWLESSYNTNGRWNEHHDLIGDGTYHICNVENGNPEEDGPVVTDEITPGGHYYLVDD